MFTMVMEDKVCIVTGASSGIGASIAVAFAREGASVLLCGRNESRLKEVLHRCVDASKGKSERFAVAVAEMNQADDRTRICKTAVDTFGRIDVLVPCAGMMCTPIEFGKETEERYDSMMNTNLKSVFFLIQSAEAELEKSHGCIVLISSIASKIFHADSVVYHVSKGALDHMCKCLALALGPKGIRVNSVNPTFIKTRLFREFSPNGDEGSQVGESLVSTMAQFHPLHGRCGTPEEVAQAVIFLSSNSSNYVTGQILGVDAGVTLNSAAFYKTL